MITQKMCAQDSRMQDEQELSKKHKGLQAKQLERLHQAAEAASIDLGPGWTAEVKVRQQGSTAGIARCSIPLSWPANTYRRRRQRLQILLQMPGCIRCPSCMLLLLKGTLLKSQLRVLRTPFLKCCAMSCRQH